MKRAEVRWRLDKAQADAVGGDAAKNPAKVAAADAAAMWARHAGFHGTPVSGGCCVVVGGGGGGRGAKPRVGGCAFGVGRCVFRGYCQDFTKTAHFRPSEKLENNFMQHSTYLPGIGGRRCR